MFVQFKNAYLQKLFEGKPVSGKPKYSSDIIYKFKKAIQKLQYADSLREIRNLKGLNFEALKGDLKGYYSVRVDYSYRLILTVDKNEMISITEVLTVHDLTNHYQ
jgi:proteic killer suppression protein